MGWPNKLTTNTGVTRMINITMTSYWERWRLKSPASRLFTQSFIQTQIKENIKAARHWPLCGEFTGDRWIPRTNGQLRGKCVHLMTSSWNYHNLWSFIIPRFRYYSTVLYQHHARNQVININQAEVILVTVNLYKSWARVHPNIELQGHRFYARKFWFLQSAQI